MYDFCFKFGRYNVKCEFYVKLNCWVKSFLTSDVNNVSYDLRKTVQPFEYHQFFGGYYKII